MQNMGGIAGMGNLSSIGAMGGFGDDFSASSPSMLRLEPAN